MQTRTLGSGTSSLEVSAIGLGGWHLGFDSLTDEDSVRIIRTAIVPSGSDFVHGEGQWEILSAGDDTSIINFTSSFDPDFFIPPW